MIENNFHYTTGHVDENTLEAALDFLIAIEPDPDEFVEECARLGVDDTEQYKSLQMQHAVSIKCAKAALKQYGRQITPATVEAMRDKFYEIVRSPKYQVSVVSVSVSYTSLNRAWDGINGWGA